MTARRIACSAATATLWLLAGCHHRAAVRTAIASPAAPPSVDPVMVSVPPPTHRSTDTPDAVTVKSEIPVVKPVRPPKKAPRRSQPPTPPPVLATSTPQTPAATPQQQPPATSPAAAVTLGQLTASTNDPAATRDGAGQALRRERDRIAAIPGPVQTSHATEIEQARRFLRSASDSMNASDYAAALALTTKARVLLDDLLK